MEIPTPYIFKIETPTLLFGEHLFQLGNETTNNIDYAEIRGKKFDLTEIATPKVLEDLYFENNKEMFEQYKQSFVSSSMHQMYLSAEQIESELKNNRTLSLIVKEILPVITSVKLDNQLDAALNDKAYNPTEDMKDIFSSIHKSPGRTRASENTEIVDKTKDELIKKIESEYARIGTAKPKRNIAHIDDYITRELLNGGNTRRSALSESSILNDELLGGTNMLFIENRAYDLYNVPKLMLEFKNKISEGYWREISRLGPNVDPATVIESVRTNYNRIDASVVSRIINKLGSTKFNISGNFFFPIYFNESSDIISDYKKLVEKKLKIDSINHTRFQAESLKKIAEEKSQLSKLVNTDKLEINGAGFEKLSGAYYVFITTPEYVLKSPHDSHYYKFGKAKIGVEIVAMGDRNIEIRDPIVLNHYKHPFLQGNSTAQRICMGDYSTNSARRLPPGQAVLTILTKAQENLMMGYKTGRNPYNPLNDERFGPNKITKQAFEKSGLPCLNDYKG